MASLMQWTWANFRRWWGTGRPGMLQSMGSQSQTWLGDWTTTVWLLLTPKTLTDTLSDWLFSGHTGLLSVPWKYWFLIHGLVTSLVVFFLLWRYTVVKKKGKEIYIYIWQILALKQASWNQKWSRKPNVVSRTKPWAQEQSGWLQPGVWHLMGSV